MSPRIELQRLRAETAERDLAKADELIQVQARVLEGQQQEMERIAEIGRGLELLRQQVRRNAANQSQAIEELKRNDQTIRQYLSEHVPVELGLLYARPATTDPAAYRSESTVQPGAVPAAGTPAAGSE
ncbi:hypothetical protein ACFSB1_10655 [Halopseudomonas phragmitis]|uniref:hypothetical protein n=1 Tax=Halopseudomonas phragmitis TaxID=1931241 RepID=UPI001E528553|nr:hypothetical protein [Halopseudomonas phragmitis]